MVSSPGCVGESSAALLTKAAVWQWSPSPQNHPKVNICSPCLKICSGFCSTWLQMLQCNIMIVLNYVNLFLWIVKVEIEAQGASRLWSRSSWSVKTFFFLCPGRGGREGGTRRGRKRKRGSKAGGEEGGTGEEVFLFHWNVREGGDSSILLCLLRAWLLLYPQ